MSGKNIAIVGSGLGGLSAAAYLKNYGHRVTVFEKNDFPGGKISEIASDGFRFDTGPSLITMPHVLRELFENFSDSEIPELIPIEPLNRNFFPDGTRLDTYSDVDKMAAEISKISLEDSSNFRRFYDYSKKIYDKSAQIFLHEPVHEIRKLLAEKKFPPLTDFLQIDSMRTVHKAVSSFFENEKIIQIFDRYPTYNGSDPFKAPATLNIIPYVEFGFGGWYVKGGIYRLVENLVNNLVNSGVEFRFHSEVNKIVHRNGRVTGIEVNGKLEEFDVVISNSDVVNTFEKLIDGFPGKRKKLQKMEPSISGMVFLWGVEGEYPSLEHHNVFFFGKLQAGI
jgi:phytoene desaturase